jgi:hypothetical protein
MIARRPIRKDIWVQWDALSYLALTMMLLRSPILIPQLSYKIKKTTECFTVDKRNETGEHKQFHSSQVQIDTQICWESKNGFSMCGFIFNIKDTPQNQSRVLPPRSTL